MTDRTTLSNLVNDARRLITDGDLDGARRLIEAIAADPDRDRLGSETMAGEPRRLHATRLRLAKAEGDTIRRMGLQQSLVPPPERLAPLAACSASLRRLSFAAANAPVPRCLHQIWIGPRPVPAGCDAWRRHAAATGYRYRLWREDDLARLGAIDHVTFRQRVDDGDVPGAVDVARYHVLAAEGGIYLDCDWYPARDDIGFHDRLPMTGLAALAEDVPRATGAGSLLLANSLIVAPAGHPLFARLLAILPAIAEALPGAPAWWATGPLVFTLLARQGPITLADAGLVAGTLAGGAAPGALATLRRQAVDADGGLLIAWKPW